MLLHASSGYHYIHVFPDDVDLRKIKECYTLLFLQDVPSWMSVVDMDKFNMSSLEARDNFIIFWKRLPPWLPMKCEARIALQYIGPFDDKGMLIQDMASVERAIKNQMSYASALLTSDIYNKKTFSRMGIPVCDSPVGSYKELFAFKGHPSPKKLSERKFTTTTYGPLFGHRRKVHDFLSKHIAPGKYFHYDGPPEFLPEILSESRSVLYITEPSEPIHPVHIMECAYNGAVFLSSSDNVYPLDQMENGPYQVFKRPDTFMSSLNAMKVFLLDESLAHQEAQVKKWVNRVSRLHPGSVMEEYVIPASGN